MVTTEILRGREVWEIRACALRAAGLIQRDDIGSFTIKNMARIGSNICCLHRWLGLFPEP